MSRVCEVCGRPIKTGRKYCWEHRHTNQAEGMSSIDKLERIYKRSRVRPFVIKMEILFIVLWVISIIIASFQKYIDFFVVMTIVTIGYIFIGGFILIIIGEIFRNKVRNEIINRSPKFVAFAQRYGEAIKSKREFSKSIFRR